MDARKKDDVHFVLTVHFKTKNEAALLKRCRFLSAVPGTPAFAVPASRFAQPPLVVGAGIKTGLNICIDDPGQVGADLVVGAVGALAVAEAPIIVVDMGTATTVTVVDEGSRFLGGAILPGLQLSMEALSSGTSLLPRVSLDAPKKVISTNTIECMQSGAIFGSASMIDGMIERMEAELGKKCSVVATGGLAGVVAPFCRRDILLEPDLLLKGLSILWEKNRRAPRT